MDGKEPNGEIIYTANRGWTIGSNIDRTRAESSRKMYLERLVTSVSNGRKISRGVMELKDKTK